jgi:phosphonate transport system substrate-binding protein
MSAERSAKPAARDGYLGLVPVRALARLRPISGALAVLLLLWLVASADSGETTKPGPAIRFGVVAEEPSEPGRMLRVYGELVALLRQRLGPAGIQVPNLVIARNLEDLSQRIRASEVDFVIETVFPSLVLRERSRRLEPRLVVLRRNQREYRSVFFARKESAIRTLADLRGKTLVLQALRSTSAFALPKAELARAGIALAPASDAGANARAARYVLADAEINQAVWVLHGRGEAGAFNEGDWAALPAGIRDELRIFHETRPILRGLLSFRTGLDAWIREQAEQLLLRLHEDDEGRAVLSRTTGITRLERLTAEDLARLREWEGILRTAGQAP